MATSSWHDIVNYFEAWTIQTFLPKIDLAQQTIKSTTNRNANNTRPSTYCAVGRSDNCENQKSTFLWTPLRSGSVCSDHHAAPGSNPKHNSYALAISTVEMDQRAFAFALEGTAENVNTASTLQIKIKFCVFILNSLAYFPFMHCHLVANPKGELVH